MAIYLLFVLNPLGDYEFVGTFNSYEAADRYASELQRDGEITYMVRTLSQFYPKLGSSYKEAPLCPDTIPVIISGREN